MLGILLFASIGTSIFAGAVAIMNGPNPLDGGYYQTWLQASFFFFVVAMFSLAGIFVQWADKKFFAVTSQKTLSDLPDYHLHQPYEPIGQNRVRTPIAELNELFYKGWRVGQLDREIVTFNQHTGAIAPITRLGINSIAKYEYYLRLQNGVIDLASHEDEPAAIEADYRILDY